MTLETQIALESSAKTHSLFVRVALVAALASLATAMFDQAEARGRGGPRGGGISLNRGGGPGGLGRGGIRAPSRPTSIPQAGGVGIQRPGGGDPQRPQIGSRPVGEGSGAIANPGNLEAANPQGNHVRAQGNGNTGVVGSADNINRNNGNTGVVGNNVNTGNVNVGNNVDVDVETGGWDDYPAGSAYVAGVAVGTTATAAAIGSYYSTLPAGCSPYWWNAVTYYTCGASWYAPRSQGTSIVYVEVANPTATKP